MPAIVELLPLEAPLFLVATAAVQEEQRGVAAGGAGGDMQRPSGPHLL